VPALGSPIRLTTLSVTALLIFSRDSLRCSTTHISDKNRKTIACTGRTGGLRREAGSAAGLH
jgi:hypothetical protein